MGNTLSPNGTLYIMDKLFFGSPEFRHCWNHVLHTFFIK